jgi:translation initiation factor IF-1
MPSAAGPALEVNGVVREALPNGLFRVAIESEARATALAHVSGGSSLLRLLPGDPVVLELFPYDMTRGRIVRKRA